MTPSRVSLDSVAWPLWLLSISHLIVAICMTIAIVRAEQAIRNIENTYEEMSSQMRKSMKAAKSAIP